MEGLAIDFNLETGEVRFKIERKMAAEALLGKGFIIGREHAHWLALRILELHGYLSVREAIGQTGQWGKFDA